jgi:NADH:ubiquinone oxidoreductase subunit 3 (subunit A)
MEKLIIDYLYFFIFLIIGAGFVIIAYIANILLSSLKTSKEKLIPYECGITPKGTTFIQQFIRYYLICLIFVVFDVEVAFLIPWAIVFKSMGMFAFVEMIIFITILVIGLIYAIIKKAFVWE